MSTTVQKRCEVCVIVAHKNLHLDEWAAICVLREYGGELFPGIEQARIEVFNPSTVHDVRSKTEEEWLSEGYLFIGVGGGGWRFVDHPHKEHPEECAFTMVLEYLGLNEDSAWVQVGKEVLKEDRNGAQSSLHIASLTKAANEYMDPAEAVVEIPRMVNFFLLEAYRKKQEAFQEALVEQREGKGDVCQVIRVENRHTELTHMLTVVCSNNSETAAAARYNGATLVVHVRDVELSTQQVYISCNRGQGLKELAYLASQIRREEQKRDCQETEVAFEETEWSVLAEDGEFLRWYYQKDAGALFNRTLTASHASKTRLTVEEIVRLSREFLRGTRSIKLLGRKR